MEKRSNVLQFPTVAKPSIDDVFADFLKDQTKRLKKRTYRRYESIIELYQHYLNGYGPIELIDASELVFYERLTRQRENGIDFCAVFGPDKVLDGLQMFLSYFMIRKVMASQDLLSASGTVTRKLARWLAEKGYVAKEKCRNACVLAARAAKELPAAERLAQLFYNYTRTHTPLSWTAELDDYFIVEDIQPGVLFLSGLVTPTGIIELKVPREITEQCHVGWQINLLLVKTRSGWQILETGNVYP